MVACKLVLVIRALFFFFFIVESSRAKALKGDAIIAPGKTTPFLY